MKIGIDARMYGLEHAGIGRYIMNLVEHLAVLDKNNQYVLLVQTKYHQKLNLPENFTTLPVPIRHYTFAEQLKLPAILNKLKCDFWHFPHFNVPVFAKVPFIVTIHDILWHQIKGTEVTTLPPWLYHLKYLGYRFVTRHAVFRSETIIVPSIWVKNQLAQTFEDLSPAKIKVVYEAAEESLLSQKTKPAKKSTVPYLVYTGSAYPHKNLRELFHALSEVNQDKLRLKLVIVSSRSVFLTELKQYVKDHHWESFITFAGFLTDRELAETYTGALALVHPSLSEGFGLTGLEAMSLGVPVVASNSGSLPEIYGDAALYFDARSAGDIAQKLTTILADANLRQSLIKKGLAKAREYSFGAMAEQTLEIYQKTYKKLNKMYKG